LYKKGAENISLRTLKS